MRSLHGHRMTFAVSLSLAFAFHAAAATRGMTQDAIQYFGAKPPGKVAKPFTPEFFANAGEGHRFGMAISDDGRERYYGVAFNDGGRFREEIRYTRYENGAWTAPKPLLDERVHKYVDPHLSPDGKRLYFIYTKPPAGNAAPKRPRFDIWYMNREGDGWSDPISLGPPVGNQDANDYFVSLTSEQTIYFGSNRKDSGNFELYSSRLGKDGKYQKPELLPGVVNTEHYEADVFVSPDESYLVFSSSGRKDCVGQGDLYISFRDEAGNWGEGINMGKEINSGGNDFAPSVSRDGKYLFYSRGGEIYWVAEEVIADFRGQAK